MSVDFYPYVRVANTDEWIFPPQLSKDGPDFEMNISEGNFPDIMHALGLAVDKEAQPVEIDRLSNLAQAALRRNFGQQSAAIPTTVDAAPDRCTMIHCGREAGYIERRLLDLVPFIHCCRNAGATHVGWG